MTVERTAGERKGLGNTDLNKTKNKIKFHILETKIIVIVKCLKRIEV